MTSIITQASIMYRNPALGDYFGKGYKMKTAYDLVGNPYDAMVPVADPNQVPIPWTAVCRRGSGVNGTCFSGACINVTHSLNNFHQVMAHVLLKVEVHLYALRSTFDEA
ncbi:predicted protein [Lichtheimia corymbifera JMRC:FSU:9682]|uniref:Uncharacterized protein n=1 Tax=Lichtheimia corymbifera JMRC:FSU:9682 TaxID=1263082 RepID=A0A068RSM9_9FUNG|nr:predicted protein [Lichtheimia corymbifera JMRC:FSU:9682]